MLNDSGQPSLSMRASQAVKRENRTAAPKQMALLFDHFVGASEHCPGEAERGGIDVKIGVQRVVQDLRFGFKSRAIEERLQVIRRRRAVRLAYRHFNVGWNVLICKQRRHHSDRHAIACNEGSALYRTVARFLRNVSEWNVWLVQIHVRDH